MTDEHQLVPLEQVPRTREGWRLDWRTSDYPGFRLDGDHATVQIFWSYENRCWLATDDVELPAGSTEWMPPSEDSIDSRPLLWILEQAPEILAQAAANWKVTEALLAAFATKSLSGSNLLRALQRAWNRDPELAGLLGVRTGENLRERALAARESALAAREGAIVAREAALEEGASDGG